MFGGYHQVVIRQALALGCLLAGVLVAGCNEGRSVPPSLAPSSFDTASSPRESSSTLGASPAVGQTDTSWGRIWDEVPEAFPLFPGGLPGGGTSESVSAMLTYDGVEPREVVTWMQMQLERATYTTEGLNGPLEDSSYVLDSTGSGGCRIQVKASPMGSLVGLIVRYGADCPAP